MSSRPRSVSSVDDARQALGWRLRDLRRDAGWTGRQLADRLDWPASKISKLENGRQAPTEADITAWATATGAADQTASLLASLRTLEIQHAEWQRQLRAGLSHHQQQVGAIDAASTLIRAFESTYIPGLLQTAEYARARYYQSALVFGPELTFDIDEAVRARLQRQELLYRRDKRFCFVITEAALRYRLCPREVMLAQLDRLVALSALRNVRLGVIAFDTSSPLAVAPAHGFWLHDDRVLVETISAELHLTQPRELELYANVFDKLAAAARYGTEARALITRVIDDLTTLGDS